MLIFLFLHISEQGRRNDLKNKKNDVNGLISVSASNSSDSVHCNLSTQFTVSSGWSCHTTASCADTDDDHDSSPRLSCPGTPHSWVHVFSRSSTSTSLRTQCAAESTKVLHWRSRRAKKKEQKLTSSSSLYWKNPNCHIQQTGLDDLLGCNWIGGDCAREADDLRHLEMQCDVDDKILDELTNCAY